MFHVRINRHVILAFNSPTVVGAKTGVVLEPVSAWMGHLQCLTIPTKHVMRRTGSSLNVQVSNHFINLILGWFIGQRIRVLWYAIISLILMNA